MFKLNENGFITTMNDTIIYNNEEEYEDERILRKFSKIAR